MYQVQWGRQGRWSRQEFNDRKLATEFWKDKVNTSESQIKVVLYENIDNESIPIMSQGGMK